MIFIFIKDNRNASFLPGRKRETIQYDEYIRDSFGECAVIVFNAIRSRSQASSELFEEALRRGLSTERADGGDKDAETASNGSTQEGAYGWSTQAVDTRRNSVASSSLATSPADIVATWVL